MKLYTKFILQFPLLVLSVFVFTVTFSACSKEDDISIYAIEEGRFDLNADEYVTMQIAIEEGTNLLRFENHTEWGFYGYSYTLQYYNNNNWESDLLQGKIIWSGGYGSHPGETKEYGIDIIPYVKIYNNNKKGMYKLTMIIELFRFSSWWPPESEERIFGIVLSTEFEVK